MVGQVGEVPDLQMSVHVPAAAAAPARASTTEERSIDGNGLSTRAHDCHEKPKDETKDGAALESILILYFCRDCPEQVVQKHKFPQISSVENSQQETTVSRVDDVM